ncbi:unnamed protein product [Strongylus vulgaris]|uniref:Uncharacterized protein n=1 Tax=Strongylus vulgaris TaxID=40348 RepID=A0A3P7ITP1_STRVU|nr:unnamed protein product [Strongylus vulgaris]
MMSNDRKNDSDFRYGLTSLSLKNEDPTHQSFDPKVRRTEPVFQMSEADWSQYNSAPNSKKKDASLTIFFGQGFPTSSEARRGMEGAENHQRYREASDSEWDSYQLSKEATEESVHREHSRVQSDLHSRGRTQSPQVSSQFSLLKALVHTKQIVKLY